MEAEPAHELAVSCMSISGFYFRSVILISGMRSVAKWLLCIICMAQCTPLTSHGLQDEIAFVDKGEKRANLDDGSMVCL